MVDVVVARLDIRAVGAIEETSVLGLSFESKGYSASSLVSPESPLNEHRHYNVYIVVGVNRLEHAGAGGRGGL